MREVAGRPVLRLGMPARLGSACVLILGAVLLPTQAVAQEQEVESPAAATLRVTSASEAATEHFWTGLEEWFNIDAPVAVEHFELAVAADPELGIARALHGFVAPGLSNEETADAIESGLSAMGDATTAEHLVVLAIRELNDGNQQEGIALLETASELVPADANVAYFEAIVAGAGVERMKAITEEFPTFAPAYNILAYNAWNEGDRELALEAVRKYVELVGDHPNPHDSYAEILQWDGQLEEAAAQYQMAADIRPGFNEAYFGLAEVNWLMGNTKEARANIGTGISYAPTQAAKINGKRALANSYLMEGKRKEAMRILEEVAAEAEAADMKGLAAVTYRAMAATDAVLGNGKSVDTYLVKAAEIGGADTPAQYAWSAYSNAMAGNIELAEKALGDLEPYASDDGATPVHAVKAMLHIEGDRVEQALAELEKADESDAFIKALKAECYKELNRNSEFKELRASVLDDPTISFFDPAGTFARLHAKRL